MPKRRSQRITEIFWSLININHICYYKTSTGNPLGSSFIPSRAKMQNNNSTASNDDGLVPTAPDANIVFAMQIPVLVLNLFAIFYLFIRTYMRWAINNSVSMAYRLPFYMAVTGQSNLILWPLLHC